MHVNIQTFKCKHIVLFTIWLCPARVFRVSGLRRPQRVAPKWRVVCNRPIRARWVFSNERAAVFKELFNWWCGFGDLQAKPHAWCWKNCEYRKWWKFLFWAGQMNWKSFETQIVNSLTWQCRITYKASVPLLESEKSLYFCLWQLTRSGMAQRRPTSSASNSSTTTAFRFRLWENWLGDEEVWVRRKRKIAIIKH